ncbi:MAG: metal-dependent hydrolase [Gammaproteobacteria bacterium]|nr:metal-dependent hydrolase [Gammaproteobacteria bacterium]NIR84325.1 metal-dependent hydrolase [Gammaproteobacteria bacterium]NIR89841.1 metal-dependent hydrolase [Gammaproteobacteria bacterium]NIU05708.1 metal-dependent hydrolase [Gammaproteobacteria bacterium]NIV52468.1 metal-dependent hydrolase [Gammaproteobacteria bacterium]
MTRARRSFVLLFLSGLMLSGAVPAAQAEEAVQMTFLGNMGFRFTSPDGHVILTDPWLEGNPDAPFGVGDIERADLILVSGAHPDNVGDAAAIAKQTGATVIATSELGAWLMGQGVPRGQLHSMMPGGLYERDGVSVKVVHAVHTAGVWSAGQATPGYGGMSIGFVITFENGLRVYFSGDTGLFGDMRLFGSLYRPDVAILSAAGRYMMEPEDGALAARLLRTDNPELTTVIPAHHRLEGTRPEEAPTARRLQREVDRLQIPVTVLTPAPGEPQALEK